MSKTLTPEDAARMKAEREARRAQLAVEESAAGVEGNNPAPEDARWSWYGEQDWASSPPLPRRWLLTRPADVALDGGVEVGFLPRGKVGMVAAAGGAGKTMALLQLAVSVATGHPWLGGETVSGFSVPQDAQGHVCLLLAEEDAEEVQRRMIAIKNTLNLDAQQWDLVRKRLLIRPMAGEAAQLIEPDGERGKTRETAFFQELRKRLDERGVNWSLIVLDPLSRLATAETEVDNHHATRFIATIEKLVNVRGNPTVLVAHHSNKSARGGVGAGSTNAARGASGLSDGVRWMATLDYPVIEKSEEPQLTLSLVKHNYNPPAAPRALSRGVGGVLFERAIAPQSATTPVGKASKKTGKTSKPEESEDVDIP